MEGATNSCKNIMADPGIRTEWPKLYILPIFGKKILKKAGIFGIHERGRGGVPFTPP